MSPEGQQITVAEERRQSVGPEKRAQGRKTTTKAVILPETLTVKRLADITHISPIDAIKQLMRNGIMASMNQVIDFEVATLVTSAFGIRVKLEEEKTTSTKPALRTVEETDPSRLVARPPW